jgi:hypothetical protein
VARGEAFAPQFRPPRIIPSAGWPLASMQAGRLIDRKPFEKLGISRGRGRRDQQPPSEEKA